LTNPGYQSLNWNFLLIMKVLAQTWLGNEYAVLMALRRYPETHFPESEISLILYFEDFLSLYFSVSNIFHIKKVLEGFATDTLVRFS